MTDKAEWSEQGATLSDKAARTEYGLTQAEIYAAIRAGTLQYREQSMHGNPWFRLLRREVEALVAEKGGEGLLHKQQNQSELNAVEKQLRSLRRQIAKLERRKLELEALLQKLAHSKESGLTLS